MDALDALTSRRSFGKLSSPAPNVDELKSMLDAAMHAPDHNELRPWKFVVMQDDALVELGNTMAEALAHREPDATHGQLDKERSKPMRAPVIIAVAAMRVETTLPFSELIASACAATQNLLLAAHALGYGAIWRTGDVARDDHVKRWLKLKPQDELVGFVYMGTARGPVPDRAPIDNVSIEWRS